MAEEDIETYSEKLAIRGGEYFELVVKIGYDCGCGVDHEKSAGVDVEASEEGQGYCIGGVE